MSVRPPVCLSVHVTLWYWPYCVKTHKAIALWFLHRRQKRRNQSESGTARGPKGRKPKPKANIENGVLGVGSEPPLHQLMGPRERCKLPQHGPGRCPGWKRIWCVLGLKEHFAYCLSSLEQFCPLPPSIPTQMTARCDVGIQSTYFITTAYIPSTPPKSAGNEITGGVVLAWRTF